MNNAQFFLFILCVGAVIYWVQSGGLQLVHRALSRVANTYWLYVGLVMICLAVAYPTLLDAAGSMNETAREGESISNLSVNLSEVNSVANVLASWIMKGGACLVVYAFAEKLIVTIIRWRKSRRI
jgi:hypothetical protein